MAGPPGFQHARLEIEGGQVIQCLFNPKDYTVTKNNTWNTKATPGATRPLPQFGGGQPSEMSLELLFDVSLLPSSTVRTATTQLFAMMEATKGAGAGSGGKKNSRRPPKITFVWGSVISFVAFAKSLSVQYLLFRPDGEPIRATVKLGLLEAGGTQKGQNPTTRGDGSLGTHVVRDGDSLPAIAFETYGDPTVWRVIAEANGIDDPLRLRRGAPLTLPRIEG